MTKEEFAEDVYCNCWGIDISHDEFIEAFLADYDSTLSLPPAEGAETMQPHVTCPKCGSTNNSELVKNDRLCYDCNHSWSEPQPTAEGAEEYLKRNGHVDHYYSPTAYVVRMMNGYAEEFTTLHAQRIADKLVSERLRGELGKCLTWYIDSTEDLDCVLSRTEIIEMYLKSREK